MVKSALKFFATFLICLILTVAICGIHGALLTRSVLNEETLTDCFDDSEFSDVIYTRIYNSLCDYALCCDYDAEVFTDNVTREKVSEYQHAYVDYIVTGLSTDGVGIIPEFDMSGVYNSVYKATETWAVDNGLSQKQLDDTVNTVVADISAMIEDNCLPIMANDPALNKLIATVSVINEAILPACGVALLGIVALVLVNRKRISNSLWWVGSAFTVDGIIWLIPAITIMTVKPFSRLVVDMPQVTMFANMLSNTFATTCLLSAIVALGIGVILMMLKLVLRRKAKKTTVEQ